MLSTLQKTRIQNTYGVCNDHALEAAYDYGVEDTIAEIKNTPKSVFDKLWGSDGIRIACAVLVMSIFTPVLVRVALWWFKLWLS